MLAKTEGVGEGVCVCVCVWEREKKNGKNLEQMEKYIESNLEIKFNVIQFDELVNLRNEW